jgi:anti-anti-sigma regulatory factor
MWKLQKMPDGKRVLLKLSGRIDADGLPALRKAFASEAGGDNLVLDLSEVDLAGQEAVKFLAGCEASGMQLRNCPAYIRDWISRERNGGKS